MNAIKRLCSATAIAWLLVPGPVLAQANTVSASEVSDSVSQAVQRQLEPLLDELVLAANAHDTDRFLATYVHDSSLVSVFNGAVLKGWDKVEAQQLKWWNNGKSDVAYSQDGPSEFTVLSPGAAVVTNRMSSRRTLANGTTTAGNFVVTMVWQKRPDGWRIVQVHESTTH